MQGSRKAQYTLRSRPLSLSIECDARMSTRIRKAYLPLLVKIRLNEPQYHYVLGTKNEILEPVYS